MKSFWYLLLIGLIGVSLLIKVLIGIKENPFEKIIVS